MEKTMTYEKAITRLEAIVAELEKGKLTLDESVRLFEEGAGLADFCSKALESAQLKITKLESLSAKERN